jgi:putative hydrolase of the HAD superfamily
MTLLEAASRILPLPLVVPPAHVIDGTITRVVTAVLFDLDGTLWDRDRAFVRLTKAQQRAIPEMADIDPEEYVRRIVALDDHGMGDKREVYRQVVSAFGLPPHISATLFDYFIATYSSFCTPFPDALPTLHWLRAHNIKTGLITNGSTQMQQAKIEALGLIPLLDVILISEREGVRKPDPAIFNRALARLGADASCVWFVGDHPDADIEGASHVGMTAVWKKVWGHAPHATHSITALEELTALVSAASLACADVPPIRVFRPSGVRRDCTIRFDIQHRYQWMVAGVTFLR